MPTRDGGSADSAACRLRPSGTILDYLLHAAVGADITRPIAGVDAELALLAELCSGAYEFAPFRIDDLLRAREIVECYRDLPLGLTDASLIVLADRYDIDTIATLDERHFRVVRSLSGRPLRVLPADADNPR